MQLDLRNLKYHNCYWSAEGKCLCSGNSARVSVSCPLSLTTDTTAFSQRTGLSRRVLCFYTPTKEVPKERSTIYRTLRYLSTQHPIKGITVIENQLKILQR